MREFQEAMRRQNEHLDSVFGGRSQRRRPGKRPIGKTRAVRTPAVLDRVPDYLARFTRYAACATVAGCDFAEAIATCGK